MAQWYGNAGGGTGSGKYADGYGAPSKAPYKDLMAAQPSVGAMSKPEPYETAISNFAGGLTGAISNARNPPPSPGQQAQAQTAADAGRMGAMLSALRDRTDPYQIGGNLYNRTLANQRSDIERQFSGDQSALRAQLARQGVTPGSGLFESLMGQARMGATMENSRAGSQLAQHFADQSVGWDNNRLNQLMQGEGLMQSGSNSLFNRYLPTATMDSTANLTNAQNLFATMDANQMMELARALNSDPATLQTAIQTLKNKAQTGLLNSEAEKVGAMWNMNDTAAKPFNDFRRDLTNLLTGAASMGMGAPSMGAATPAPSNYGMAKVQTPQSGLTPAMQQQVPMTRPLFPTSQFPGAF